MTLTNRLEREAWLSHECSAVNVFGVIDGSVEVVRANEGGAHDEARRASCHCTHVNGLRVQWNSDCRRIGRAVWGGAGIWCGLCMACGCARPLENKFAPSEASVEVEENLGRAKENVVVRNTGDTAAWMRAELVVCWVDEAGKVVGRMPVQGEDYSLERADPSGWLEGADGLSYHVLPVEPGEATEILVRRAALTEKGRRSRRRRAGSSR